MALNGNAEAERYRNLLCRDFLVRSIFDFCNNIGTSRTCRPNQRMSVVEVKAEMTEAVGKWANRAAEGGRTAGKIAD